MGFFSSKKMTDFDDDALVPPESFDECLERMDAQMSASNFKGGFSTLATFGPLGQVVERFGGEDAQHKFGFMLGGAAGQAFETGMEFAISGPAGAAPEALSCIMNEGLIDIEILNNVTADEEYVKGMAAFQEKFNFYAKEYGVALDEQVSLAEYSYTTSETSQQSAFELVEDDFFCKDEISHPDDLIGVEKMSTQEFC